MGGLVNQGAFNDTFNTPGSTMIGLIVSIMEVGAFFGSIATAVFGEKIGRKKSIAIGVLILILGSLLQATAYQRAHLIVARIVTGIGLGMVNSTVPVMQAEFSPKATRGLCTCLPIYLVFCFVIIISGKKAMCGNLANGPQMSACN